MGALGLEGMDWNGSFLYGAAIGGAGLIFMGLTLIAGQLVDNTRGALGLGMLAAGGFYVVRAIGDISNDVFNYFSPFGWLLKTEVYVTNIWTPLIVTIAAAFLVTASGMYLYMRRDLGSGLLPQRPGKGKASPALLTPFGLAWRLQRMTLAIWFGALFFLGITYGSVLGDVDVYFDEIEYMAEFLPPIEGFSLADQFLGLILVIMAIIAAIPVIMQVTKLYAEEKKVRAEIVTSLAVSRYRLMASYVLLAVITSFVMLFASASGLALGAAYSLDEAESFASYVGAGMTYLPALWVMAGVALLLIGLVPSWTSAVWGYLFASFVIVYMGGLFQFPDWTQKISPFGFVPGVPVEDFELLPLLGLTGTALLLGIAGFVSYRRRDL
jgi:ABC-2 type transport system permease protein